VRQLELVLARHRSGPVDVRSAGELTG